MSAIAKLSELIAKVIGYINSFGEYIQYVKDSVTQIFSGSNFPPVITAMVAISILCLVVYFIRAR